MMLKPYYCVKCGALFTAEAVVGQLTTWDPCPVCKENNGNGRADKSSVEVANEYYNVRWWKRAESFNPHATTNRETTDA